MLEPKKGVDIIKELGGIRTLDEAMKVFEERMDARHLARIKQITVEDALLKIANAIALCDPATVYVNTGSAADKEYIRALALERGEEEKLPMKDHTIHFDLKEEQGRIVDRTFYIVNEGEAVSSLAKRMLRDQAMEEIRERMTGIMKGRTMIVGFYNRGPVGSPAANPAIEISSSAYVCHSAEILYRNAYADFNFEVAQRGYFFTNLHSEGENRPEDLPNARVFMDRSHWTTYSMLCTYAGNTLLLKKGNHRFAVDKAVYLGESKELSEHMFITGVEDERDGHVAWCVGAAPSGCGKTTTAMAGDHFVGDDLAQMWIADDGTVRAVNPESGIFGIVKDVNMDGDPHLMDLLRERRTEVIFSNVLIDENGVPRWTGDGGPPPTRGRNFQGEWEAGMTDENGNPIPMSHPNARCTVSARALPNYSPESENPNGVPVRIVTYSGRDSDTMPPVWVAADSDQGVVIGACIVSAATATEVGAKGVKRAPWANAPFIPGALGDYMNAQFDFWGSKAIKDDHRPVLAGLNYFLTHEARGGSGTGLLGEKRDVKAWLTWLSRYSRKIYRGIETPIGVIPRYDDLAETFQETIGKEYPEELYEKQFSLYVDKIIGRIDLQREAFGKEENIPDKFFKLLDDQKTGLLALKEKFGAIVKPRDLAG